MKKRIILLVLLLVILSSITGCATKERLKIKAEGLQEDIKELKEENKKLKEGQRLEVLEEIKKANENENTDNYINIKFYKDGYLYKTSSYEVHFYEDPYCNILTKDLPIISPVVDEIELEDGEKSYCVRAIKDGESVMLYSILYPDLQIMDYDNYYEYFDD